MKKTRVHRRKRSHTKKSGLPPGALVYVGKMMTTSASSNNPSSR